MAKVLGLKQLLQKKHRLLQGLSQRFTDCLGAVAQAFIMIVWGQSGQGKSSFLMQLIKELSRFGIVLYVGLEEGTEVTMQNKAKQFLSADEFGRIRFADHEMNYQKLVEYLSKKKSPQFIIIDSLQYFNITYTDYKALKEKFKKKSFIFISHAKGKMPDGKTADKIRYDAGIKIRIEGLIAFITSRYGGAKNYVIWEQGAKQYWKKMYRKLLNR